MKTIKTGIILAFIIHISSVIISDYLGINDGFFVHSTYDEYNRLRGFCSESSWVAYTLTVLGGMLFLLLHNKIYKNLVIFLTIGIVLVSGSKGSIVCVFLTILYFLYSLAKSLYIKILSLFFVIIILILAWPYLLAMFSSDLEYFTSFATRGSSVIASFLILIHYPLGTGFGAFTFAYREYMMEGFNLLEWLTGLKLNAGEIEVYTLSDIYQRGATIKSILFQWMAFFGVPFMYILGNNIKKITKELNNKDDIRCFLFFLL